MAEINILLQGLAGGDDHETAINKLFEIPNIEQYLFSIAFVRSAGVDSIKENLKKHSGKTIFFIGIRNGITSVQSIFNLLKIGVKPYVIDTASNNKIFHPKIYAAINDTQAYVILGSANLTFGGLNQNIEASSLVTLNKKEKKDLQYITKLVNTFTDLPEKYPEHIFQINNAKQAVLLLREGRLEDERIAQLPSGKKLQKNKDRDKLPPIPTHSGKAPKPHKKNKQKKAIKNDIKTSVLVWESKPLTERSLNIPKGENTNITGDTNLGLGLMENIDFQHYFRDEVFSELQWEANPTSRSPHLERAIIKAEIVIKNISYGTYDLEVTHDPRTNTRSYEQRNVMTKLKWGEARHLIAKRDLLGRTLRLYKNDSSSFVIVID